MSRENPLDILIFLWYNISIQKISDEGGKTIGTHTSARKWFKSCRRQILQQ